MMKFLLLAVATLCAKASDVVVLNGDNFEEETKALTGEAGDWLVEFYAPWCGHCKKLQPVWEELATELKGTVSVGKVDVTENRPLGSRFDIKGFPTIKFFHEGEVFPYKGARSKAAFLAYVQGGYKEVGGDKAPQQPAYTDMMIKSVTDPFKKAMQDVQNGKFLTPNTIVVGLPALAVFLIVLVMAAIPDGGLATETKKKD